VFLEDVIDGHSYFVQSFESSRRIPGDLST